MIKGISKLILPKLSMAEFFEQAFKAGYKCVELGIGREGELTLATDDAGIAAINALSSKYELPVKSCVHSQCTGNLLASGDEQKRSIDETVKGLEVARKLGATVTLTTMGRLQENLYYDDAYNNVISALKTIAPEAKRIGVRLAVEFIWNGFLFSPLEMKRLLDTVNDPFIGFYFDPGNMAVFQFPQHWARILGKHIMMAHAKDWQGGALNGGWPGLLKGKVDFPVVMAELRAAGYDDAIISEVDPAEASLEETSAALDKIIAM